MIERSFSLRHPVFFRLLTAVFLVALLPITPVGTATVSAAPPTDGLKLPFAKSNDTWDVLNGYGQRSHTGQPPFSADEIYALDLGKRASNQAADRVVVAPIGLTVISDPFPCATAGDQGEGILAKMDNRPTNHYLKICHFRQGPIKQHYNIGEPLLTSTGHAVALNQANNNSHIHINIFSADPSNANLNRQPIPFDKNVGYSLEGLTFPAVPPYPATPTVSYECIKDRGRIISGVCNIRSSQPSLSTDGGGGGPSAPNLPTLSINDVTVTEGNSLTTPAVFTVGLSATTNKTVTVDYRTADATATAANLDFYAITGTLTFARGETSKTITVSLIGDTAAEADETFFVNLSNPTNATIIRGQGVGTIRNDDSALPTTNIITSPDTGGDVGYYTFLRLDTAGNPVVAYRGGVLGNVDGYLKVLHCGNPICSSGNSIASPDPERGDVSGIALTLDATGRAVISYWLSDQLRLLRCGDPNCNSGNSITTLDTVYPYAGETAIVLDAAGHPIVAYWNRGNGAFGLIRCGNPSCTSGNSNVSLKSDFPWFNGSGVSLALDAFGRPIVASIRSYTGGFGPNDLEVIFCGDVSCSSGNVARVLDSEAVTAPTSIRVDRNGNPIVLYNKRSVGSSFLRCGNASCTTGNTFITPVISTPTSVGESLILDFNGNPVISGYSVSRVALVVLHCSNQACTSADTATEPDSAGNIDLPTWSSVVLDANGNPVVSYFDAPNRDLKILHCGNPTCTATSSVDGWTAASSSGSPEARDRHHAVWTGTAAIVWGGWERVSGYINDRAAYTP